MAMQPARQTAAARMVKLALALADAPDGLTLDEMQAELGVGRRTVERMRDALAKVVTLDSETHDGKKRFLVKTPLQALAVPDVQQLAVLRRAIDTLAAKGDALGAESLRDLETKIRTVLPTRARATIEPDLDALARTQLPVVGAGPRVAFDRQIIAVLNEARKAACRVSFRYTDAKGEEKQRVAAPRGLLFGWRVFLVAHLPGQPEPGVFRLDRMRDVVLVEGMDEGADTFDLKAYADGSFGIFREPPQDVVLRFAPSAANDALHTRFHRHQTVEANDDGTATVRFTTGGFQELAWHLFTWGPAVTIEAPQTLKDTMRGLLAAAMDHHGAPDGVHAGSGGDA